MDRKYKKITLHYLHYGGESAESAESARQKNDSANFYIGGNNRERIFYLSKITKNDSKILISFTKDTKAIKVHVYKKCM